MAQADEGAPAPAITLSRMDFAANGFGYGLSQQFLRATVAVSLPEDADWSAADAALAAAIPEGEGEAPPAADPALRRLIDACARLQRAAGRPVFEQGRVLASRPSSRTAVLALPTADLEAARRAIGLVVRLINAGFGGEPVDAVRADVDKFLAAWPQRPFGGSNTQRFLQAAHELRIPWTNLTGNVYQVGQGARSRWIDSSFTDHTPVISSNLARNKLAAADLLRQAGLPAPPHELARDAAHAVRIAERLGWPVVVKPADKDGGVGVAAGLRDPGGVERAYQAARKLSKAVLVEKHVEGRDYRLVVLDGALVWALERVPGGVTGDGSRSVRELVDALNADPRRAKRADAPLKPLAFDDEAQEMLAERGMDAASVPESGAFVRLRRAANVASGGTPVGVFERVHPANRALAERAARLLRLDLAGIDLLVPDIARPWHETGGAICEVNAQPTIGSTTSAHLYGQILRHMLNGDGRIPLAMVAGAPPHSPIPALLGRILAAGGRRVGVASARGAAIGGRSLTSAPGTVHTAARALLLDRETDAAVVVVDHAEVFRCLLPFDRCGVVALAGSAFQGPASIRLGEYARLLLPMSLGPVVIAAADPACRALAGTIRGARVALAGGDGAVRVEGGRLLLQAGTVPLDAAGEGPACAPDDVAIAAACAEAVGCTPAQIAAGLAGVRLTEPARASA
jgi:cyanophycin synthetase